MRADMEANARDAADSDREALRDMFCATPLLGCSGTELDDSDDNNLPTPENTEEQVSNYNY